MDGPQDIRIHLRRRYPGGGGTGRRPHGRIARTRQLHHVLRCQQRPALNHCRGGHERGHRRQIPCMGLERYQHRRSQPRPNTRSADCSGQGDRTPHPHHRQDRHGERGPRSERRKFREQGIDPRTASLGCRCRHRRNHQQPRRQSRRPVRHLPAEPQTVRGTCERAAQLGGLDEGRGGQMAP